MAKVYHLRATQRIPAPLADVWAFFSDPSKLAIITPPFLRFEVLSPPEPHIYAGQLIEYRVRPIAGIPMYWLTEITHVQEGRLFVDEQRKGPYNLWHHQHHFTAIEGGTLMTDLVHYSLPLGPLGRLAHTLSVARKLRQIFDFRYSQTCKLLGTWKDDIGQ